MKAFVRTVVAMFVALALASCLKLDTQLSIEDDTVSGSVVLAASKEFLAEIDETEPGALLDGLPGNDVFAEAETAPYEDDDYVGWRYDFGAVNVAEFTDPDSLVIEYDADQGAYEVSARIGSPDFDLDEMPPELAEITSDSADLSLSITFPGDVTEHNGELSGTTVRWQLAIDEVNEIHAVAGAAGDEAAGDPTSGEVEDGGDSSAESVGGLATPLQMALAFLGAGAVAAIAYWFSRRTPPSASSADGRATRR